MTRAISLSVLLAIAFVGAAHAQQRNPLDPPYATEPSQSCAQDKRVIETCRTVHGRLAGYDDMNTLLWVIGTKRLIYIYFGDGNKQYPDPPLPAELERLYHPPEVWIFGDYTICPFTHQEPRKMQYACIDKAEHLVARKPGE